jgi:hypothetical protein
LIFSSMATIRACTQPPNDFFEQGKCQNSIFGLAARSAKLFRISNFSRIGASRVLGEMTEVTPMARVGHPLPQPAEFAHSTPDTFLRDVSAPPNICASAAPTLDAHSYPPVLRI